MNPVAISQKRGVQGLEPMRIGFFGLLGSGNLGNDASFEALLRYLEAQHTDAALDALCMGPEQLTRAYGIPARRHLWYRQFEGRVTGIRATILKAVGKVVDAFETARWVRQHEVVVVPGMGVLEATLPLRASGMPYALFLVSAAGRLFGTKVALVNVGASPISQRLIRWLSNWTVRLASYQSYRDRASVDAMRRRGVPASYDQVYPDLVFGLDVPEAEPGQERTVGVGLMAFYGDNDDRARSQEIYDNYIETMRRLVHWLVETGYRVRLFWGDDVDDVAVGDVLAGWTDESVLPVPVRSLRDLMREMARVDVVVATRFHNVLSALRLAKPTIAVGYSAKHDALMVDMGMPAEFSQPARAVDFHELIERFAQMEDCSEQLRRTLAARNKERTREIEAQFELLSGILFSPARRSRVSSEISAGTLGNGKAT